ncbi:MAG: hypothetical protein ACTSVA_04010 [Candidatus Njordarchaeales archaeon]
MNIKDTLRSAWLGGVTAPILLVIIQFLSRELSLARFGLIITLYKEAPLSVSRVVRWLLISDPEAASGVNLLAVIIAWAITWAIVADWVKRIDDIVLGMILNYVVYVLYLSWYRHIPVKLYFPESFYPIPISLLAAGLIILNYKRKAKITFFDKLEKVGITIPEKFRIDLSIPLSCPSCGATLYSNSQYCWRCGADLESILYEKMAGEKK